MAAVAVAALHDLDKGSTANRADYLYHEIDEERDSQERKWGPQHHSKEKWFTILGEEVGEVANAILENK